MEAEKNTKNAVAEMLLNIFLSILSAALLILAFPKANLTFLAWFALVPWFFALQRQKSCLNAFFISYISGIIFFSGIVYWINYVSTLGFIFLVLYLAIYFGIFGLVFFKITRKYYGYNLFLIPCLWVSLEYIRSHLFSGFGWALLGYSQYRNLAVIQISDITGSYGVSFLLVLVNMGIWHLFTSANRAANYTRYSCPIYWVVFSIFSVVLVLSYGYLRLNYNPQGQKVKVAVIQGNIPQRVKWDLQARDFILRRYFRLTEQAAFRQPDIIIWPETSVPGYLEQDEQLLKKLASLSRKISPAYLLVGTAREGRGRITYNSATLLLDGRIIEHYDKLHLVPFGEFIPWPKVFSRFSFAGLIGDFSPGRDYTVFNFSGADGRVSLGVLICFEDLFAHLSRNFVKKGARLLVNMTNDAWFEDSSEPYQHLQASVFRAIENRVNLVRSANTGVSCFINPWGKILNRVSDRFGRDVLVAGEKSEKLNIVSMASFYTAFGDIFSWLCLIGTAFLLIKKRPPLP